jgi:hypothetical protein
LNDLNLYQSQYARTTEWEYFAEVSEAYFSAKSWEDGREITLENDYHAADLAMGDILYR